MALIGKVLIRIASFLPGWLGAGRAAHVAEGLRDRIAAQGGAPALGLDPRQADAWERAMALVGRLPRPLMAVGTIALIGGALIAPEWFAARMEALAALPDPLWWVMGALVSLLFGARFQAREQAFARELLSNVLPPEPLMTAATGTDAELALIAEAPGDNPALRDWVAPT